MKKKFPWFYLFAAYANLVIILLTFSTMDVSNSLTLLAVILIIPINIILVVLSLRSYFKKLDEYYKW